MPNWYRWLTGIRLERGGSLSSAVEKAGKLSWWRSKTIFLTGDYNINTDLIIPKNITIIFDAPSDLIV